MEHVGHQRGARAGRSDRGDDLDAEHWRDHAAAEALEPHRVTSSPAMAAAGALWTSPRRSGSSPGRQQPRRRWLAAPVMGAVKWAPALMRLMASVA
ncbi:MAG TPA: hypothetical protein VHT91_50635 [Kofleriaceae bacterium]|nr:hypothetical protein [Kofleriaceae bacterium]